MNLYCINCSMFTKDSNIKIKCKTDGKINVYSRCIDCSFEIFEAIHKKGLRDLLKVSSIYKTLFLIV